MKTPLRFQLTDTDCGTTSFLNAIAYLFEREEIPAELEHAIYEYTLDCVSKDGKMGSGGTSRVAMSILAHWVAVYAEVNDFPMKVKRYAGEDVTPEMVVRSMHKNSVLLMRLWQVSEHYVIVTHIDKEYVYIFDPYYLAKDAYDADTEVEMVFDRLFDYNRKVKLRRFFSQTKKDFSLGEKHRRELIVVSRIAG